MTIEISGPAQKVPGRSVLAWWIIAAVIFVIFLWLARVVGEVLVDWLWLDTLGYGALFATMWHTKLAAFGIAAGLSAPVARG